MSGIHNRKLLLDGLMTVLRSTQDEHMKHEGIKGGREREVFKDREREREIKAREMRGKTVKLTYIFLFAGGCCCTTLVLVLIKL